MGSDILIKKQLKINNKKYSYFDIKEVADKFDFDLAKLPYSLRILLENIVRFNADESLIKSIFLSVKDAAHRKEIAFRPSRILMQDFTGVPAVVDLAAMRDAAIKINKDPKTINPKIPVDLVIDHSVQVDFSGNNEALKKNVKLEMQRNLQRYEFLKWGQESFDNFRVVPPGTGICHQVNLENLAPVIFVNENKSLNENLIYPDSVVGTDSHTTMINGLAVLGWGVGGIEAEAAMLGQPISMLIPEVIGFKLTGKLQEGVTATDLVLNITNKLREKGVVGKFVEFFGDGLNALSLANRATISNMAPEYGATCGIFPIDQETLNYLYLSGRSEDQIEIVDKYAKEQGLFRDKNTIDPEFSEILELDLSRIEPTIAGPKRPQDKILLKKSKLEFSKLAEDSNKKLEDKRSMIPSINSSIGNGDVVIAAITSCTNTSNPEVLISAALLARNAHKKGLKVKNFVKTSFAPGSKVVSEYLTNSGLQEYLDNIGFNVVGYGCTSCIGNSGPLHKDIEAVIKSKDLLVSSVLSGNRNFEGRVHPLTKANYLASPPLVVAYALAGTMNIDLTQDPIAICNDGKKVYLKDLWPKDTEIKEIIADFVKREVFIKKYQDLFKGDADWQRIKVSKSDTYKWNNNSTYIRLPNFFDNLDKSEIKDIKNARVLALFGDSITTDHISPAGNIASDSVAAKYLIDQGVKQSDFNSYGSRRGNHEVMVRGTFANIRIKNKMAGGIEGGFTKITPDKELISIYDAAQHYKKQNLDLVIFAGKEYGTGSSRDWAAKGTYLQGVKAVIASSFERIHRSNLIGMGVLPLTFTEDDIDSLGLDGSEEVDIIGINANIKPKQTLKAIIRNGSKSHEIKLLCRLDTNDEVEYYKSGGILHFVLQNY
ncbi:aconitate hydratase AcnA [Rickettsiales bacterium]|nr:aconitate hydratase AcnA [Rickettsiales bacterium]